MGERTMAVIYNRLGFIDSRLYLLSKSFSERPLGRLFDRKLEAKDFTDDALLRCLDKIYEYGPTKFVFDITFSIALQLNLLGENMHLDGTSLPT